jgi:ADP-heptose:LPS heptosyltransferase
VIRLGALGDVARTLPALRSLRAHYPKAQITWLVEPQAAGLLLDDPDLDRVMIFPRDSLSAHLRSARLAGLWRALRAMAISLREPRFDLVLDFHSILKSGVLARLTGSPERVAFAPPYGRELGWLFANRRARLAPARASRYERNLSLLRFLRIDCALPGPPLAPTRRARERIAGAVEGERPFVLIHPGSSVGAHYKRYAPARYGSVARRLVDEGEVDCLVVTGASSAESELADRIVEASAGRARLAPPTPDLSDLVALLAAARLVLGGDSGPLHMASLAGTPVVQIMGPTHPLENEPHPGTPWRRARVDVACNPCRRGCARATCMQVIPYESVLEHARELLEADASTEMRRASGTCGAVGS